MNWKNKLIQEQVIWRYPGYGPHAQFTLSNKHANSYFNSGNLADKPSLLKEICESLHQMYLAKSACMPDRVVTYAPYGLGIGFGLAKLFNCQFTFTEADKLNAAGLGLQPGEKALLCADDLHTGKSITETINAVRAKQAEIVGPLIFLANCSGKDNLHGREVMALIDFPIESWLPDECPLCTSGSKPLEARKHWQDLCSQQDHLSAGPTIMVDSSRSG